MVRKKQVILMLLLSVLIFTLSGCEKNLSSEELRGCLQNVSEISIPKGVSIVGLGEATHGNKEFIELKKEVFNTLVKNYGYRVFALEGDFGGCQVVNNYILNGNGTAEDSVKAIGFAIYKTQEMVDLVKWMHDYNSSVSDKEKLKFYGFDMQRYDCNKAGLLSYIKKVDGEKYSNYEASLANLNDETVFNQEKEKVKKGLSEIEKIIGEMEKNKNKYMTKSSRAEYDIACQYALCIKENATLRGTNVNYSENRDEYMAKKVQWILSYEKDKGNSALFIAGHNGHIEKTSASPAGYTSMGQRLKETYGDRYFAIGTDFYKSTFLCKDSLSKERKEFSIKNNKNDLIKMFIQTEKNIGLLDIKRAQEKDNLNKILSSKQRMGNVGDEFSIISKIMPAGYTISMIPKNAYDAIIFVRDAKAATTLK